MFDKKLNYQIQKIGCMSAKTIGNVFVYFFGLRISKIKTEKKLFELLSFYKTD